MFGQKVLLPKNDHRPPQTVQQLAHHVAARKSPDITDTKQHERRRLAMHASEPKRCFEARPDFVPCHAVHSIWSLEACPDVSVFSSLVHHDSLRGAVAERGLRHMTVETHEPRSVNACLGYHKRVLTTKLSMTPKCMRQATVC